MATVLKKNGFDFVIYTLDHEPPHVHVKKAGNEMRVDISGDDPVIMSTYGFTTKEQRYILEVVSNHQQYLLQKWGEFHG